MCRNCRYEETLELIGEALDRVEDLPASASDFADGVTDRLESIGDWIEKKKHTTDKQKTAVTNMYRGIERWLD